MTRAESRPSGTDGERGCRQNSWCEEPNLPDKGWGTQLTLKRKTWNICDLLMTTKITVILLIVVYVAILLSIKSLIWPKE